MARMPAKAARNKIGQYSLVGKFAGYKAREDQTTLTPNTLVSPSKNVVLNTAGRIATVAGYALDGAGSTTQDSGILSFTDFENFKSDVRNMRAGFLTSAGNDGKIQYRYQVGSTVTWVTLKSALTNVRLSFAEFWDNTALLKLLLWVDGSSNINEWNGAVTTLASVTAPSATVISTINTTVIAGGVGYSVGDILTVNGGTGGRVQVATLSGSAVATVTLLDVGTGGYTVGTIGTTDITTPGATGCTISITALQTASTITKQGTNTWAQEGFYQARNKSIVIGGTAYAYQTGYDTTTLTGVTPDPTSGSYAVGSIIHQAPITNPLSAMQGILATFTPTVLGCGRNNQLYVGSSTSNSLYISKVNNYVDYRFTTPTRVVGEGMLLPLDAPPTLFIPMEVRTDENAYDMWISEGRDRWAVIRATLSADLTAEKLEHIRLKVAPLQGAQSAHLAGKMKNHIIFVGYDNVANFMGYLSFENVPETVDFSAPIIDDMKGYDFTDGAITYHKNYIHIAIPKAGLIRTYNMTDQSQQTTSSIRGVEDVDSDQPWFWEAPTQYPISGFYRVAGALYGHSYTTSESYKLFSGGSFGGQDIEAIATLAFDDHGDRTQSKGSDELWIEGYIKQNTKLNVTVAGDLDAFQTAQSVTVDGSDNSIVAYGSGAHALGKNPLGSQPLGGAELSSALPAWFHVAKSFNQVPGYLEQLSFSTKGVDLSWQLITFGTNATMTAEGNNSITQ